MKQEQKASVKHAITAIAVAILTVAGALAMASPAAAADATIRCGTLTGATTTSIASTVGATYTITNLSGTFPPR